MTTRKKSMTFEEVEETVWLYCSARKLENDRDELAYRLATEPTDLMEDIASFGTNFGDKKNADYIAELIERYN